MTGHNDSIIKVGSCWCVLLTLGAHAHCARVTVLSVCESVTSLTATPLMHRYKVRYESNANALLKVFDSWISLKIFCSKVTALFAQLHDFDGQFDGKEIHQMDYWRLLVG